MKALVRSSAPFVERISNLWVASVEAFIACGRTLMEAKATLDHGEFEHMVENELPFGPRKAQMLIAIAEHSVLSKAIHGSLLPPSYRTLYQLSRLPVPVLQQALADGTINPDIGRSEVAALVAPRAWPETETPTETTDAIDRLIALGRKFGTIYADPPWAYGNQSTRAATDNHYSTMSVDEIASLPIGQIAADDSHLHLWTTNGFLFDARRVMDAWGFEYRSCFVWVKPQMGIGNYWRVSHEFLLLGIRGDATCFAEKSLISWAQLPRTKHSKKPELVRRMIEKASPTPRFEAFGRRPVDGWTVWGDEIRGAVYDAMPEEIAL